MTLVPILRHGQPYESIDKVTLVHHATGEPVAEVSQANPGMIVRDINRMDDTILERFTVRELIDICGRAADRFVGGVLPIGDAKQSFDDYVRQLSATTGMPITYCRSNAAKIRRVLAEMDTIIAGLTRGFDLSILDRGFGVVDGRTLSFFRESRIFGAVLPSNSPGVHGLWIPAIALKAPIVLKPGREEPWTPLRIIEALAAEGVPREAFGFYPTDHAGANELLRSVDRAMLFGDTSTTAPWKNDPRVEIHGPGFSKVILGDDAADNWERHLDIMEGSIAANGGRSCINASGVWTPHNGRKIAKALAKRLAKVQALPADDPGATIAGFANPAMAERMSAMIDHQLGVPGAVDLTEQFRGSPRLVTRGRVSYLLPTILWCEDREHSLSNREFLFPFASVVECPTAEMPEAIGRSLVVSAITVDQRFIAAIMASPNVDRLNIGPIPSYQLSWDQPHEGNLFEHLYRQRAFQKEPAA
jgi:acyl-CoA reductase-like NAD-dependent aldehyde dehydrogenase